MHHHLAMRNKLIIMLSVMASMFLVALDQTIIATALGTIVEEFNAFDSLSWIVTAYLLTTTITVPIAGKMSDLFGRKSILLIGVAIFSIGSLLSGSAATIEQLVLYRALQGIGGGIITANAFTIVGDLFAARERGRWQGMIGAVFGLSSLVGPLLGGWLTDGQSILGMTTDWRWTFWINVPVGIAAFVIIMIFCPPLKHDKKPTIDYIGAALLTVALATLVLAVDNTEAIFANVMSTTGLSLIGLRTIMCAIVVAAVIGFIAVERRAKEPILPPMFFRNRNYILIIGIATLFGSAFMGAILYLTQFNQQVFGASPTESGMMLLPMVGGLMLTSIVSGQIISRTGKYKIFMQIGIVLATIMIGMLTFLTPETPYIYEAVVMTLLGAGLGVVMPVMTLAVQNEFKQHELGAATSSSQLFRSLGSTIGIAIFGAMLTAGIANGLTDMQSDPYLQVLRQNPQASRMSDVTDSNTLLGLNMPDTKQQITHGFETATSTLPEPLRTASLDQFKQKQAAYADKITHAFSESLRSIFIVSTILMSCATVLVFSLKERPLKSANSRLTPGAE
ncbi:MAG: MDR family MFS transporter [Candidatus Saccharimonadales bacterium]